MTASCCCTGPPTNATAGGAATSAQSGSASLIEASVGWLSTSPTAPSSVCSITNTTERKKFGSSSVGTDTSRRRAADGIAPQPIRTGCGWARRRGYFRPASRDSEEGRDTAEARTINGWIESATGAWEMGGALERPEGTPG